MTNTNDPLLSRRLEHRPQKLGLGDLAVIAEALDSHLYWEVCEDLNRRRDSIVLEPYTAEEQVVVDLMARVDALLRFRPDPTAPGELDSPQRCAARVHAYMHPEDHPAGDPLHDAEHPYWVGDAGWPWDAETLLAQVDSMLAAETGLHK